MSTVNGAGGGTPPEPIQPNQPADIQTRQAGPSAPTTELGPVPVTNDGNGGASKPALSRPAQIDPSFHTLAQVLAEIGIDLRKGSHEEWSSQLNKITKEGHAAADNVWKAGLSSGIASIVGGATGFVAGAYGISKLKAPVDNIEFGGQTFKATPSKTGGSYSTFDGPNGQRLYRGPAKPEGKEGDLTAYEIGKQPEGWHEIRTDKGNQAFREEAPPKPDTPSDADSSSTVADQGVTRYKDSFSETLHVERHQSSQNYTHVGQALQTGFQGIGGVVGASFEAKKVENETAQQVASTEAGRITEFGQNFSALVQSILQTLNTVNDADNRTINP